jgi:hypothetical protein
MLGKTLFAAGVAVLVASSLLWRGVRDDRPAPAVDAAAEESETRADETLPTDPPRPEGRPAGPRPAGPAISLIEAVTIAEQLGSGQAIRAERKDKPEVSFKVDLLLPDGRRTKIDLTADGRVKEKKDDD